MSLGAPGAMGVLIATLSLAGISAAEFKKEADSARFLTAHLSLRGSHGYTITISAYQRRTMLTAVRGGTVASYVGRGGLTAKSLWANFGPFGEAQVRFKPVGPVRHVEAPRGCAGRPSTIRLGKFVGEIRFSGESGYTTLHQRYAQGGMRVARWNCSALRAQEELREDELQKGVIALAARAPIGRRFFGALRKESESFSAFVAATQHRRGFVHIERRAVALGESNAYLVDHERRVVVVQPPWPFFGTGVLDRENPGGGTWSGTLGVSLPGAGDVTLTGEDFRAGPVGPKSLSRIVGLLDPP
jgi:hypothetical protein